MNDIEYRNTLYEVNEIFGALDKDLINQVPAQLIDKIKTNKSENYNFKLDPTKPLKEQKLLKTTKEFISGLYLTYWADEQEKNNMKKRMLENERRQQEEFDKNFKESIFHNPPKEATPVINEPVKIEAAMIETKANPFKTFLKKITDFFSRK